ncbi:DUF3667 domain-containing protein [Cryomorphaceae bacterium 1068]|nr:DUF3667 domain-containing protein [Cryomorphaceae bacterium 1068]
MENGQDIVPTTCLNCGASIEGNFCSNCGQSMRDNSDRSVGRLFGEFFSSIFFLDNRLLISLWYSFAKPGQMTVEFLAGKRKKFISPISLFLLFNLVYFLVNPLSDYSLSLYDQIYSQPYSEWTKEWAIAKIQNEGLDGNTYAVSYQKMSDTISKSILIINVPLVAFFVYLVAFKKRRFYYDSLIFTFHFFSLFLFSLVLLDWVYDLFDLFPEDVSTFLYSVLPSTFFILVIPLIYATLSIKRFMAIRWYWSIPAGFGVMLSILLVNLFYRFIIYGLTLWAT